MAFLRVGDTRGSSFSNVGFWSAVWYKTSEKWAASFNAIFFL